VRPCHFSLAFHEKLVLWLFFWRGFFCWMDGWMGKRAHIGGVGFALAMESLFDASWVYPG
jgi:hypothetical protein